MRRRPSLRTAARTLRAFRPGDLLGRSLGPRRPGAGHGRRCLRRCRASLPGALALPHVAEPGLLAVRRRSPCARAPRAAGRALQALDALGARGHAAPSHRPLRRGGRRPPCLLAPFRDRGGGASHPPRRPGCERRHGQRRLHPHHDGLHRARPTRQCPRCRAAGRARRGADTGLRDRGDRERCGRQHRGGEPRAAGAGAASGRHPALRSLLPGASRAAAAAVLAAFGAHAALAGSSWWLSLAATTVCGLAGYCAVLPFVLPSNERAAIATSLGRIAGQRSPGGLPPMP